MKQVASRSSRSLNAPPLPLGALALQDADDDLSRHGASLDHTRRRCSPLSVVVAAWSAPVGSAVSAGRGGGLRLARPRAVDGRARGARRRRRQRLRAVERARARRRPTPRDAVARRRCCAIRPRRAALRRPPAGSRRRAAREATAAAIGWLAEPGPRSSASFGLDVLARGPTLPGRGAPAPSSGRCATGRRDRPAGARRCSSGTTRRRRSPPWWRRSTTTTARCGCGVRCAALAAIGATRAPACRS